jgi:hypothetical protein
VNVAPKTVAVWQVLRGRLDGGKTAGVPSSALRDRLRSWLPRCCRHTEHVGLEANPSAPAQRLSKMRCLPLGNRPPAHPSRSQPYRDDVRNSPHRCSHRLGSPPRRRTHQGLVGDRQSSASVADPERTSRRKSKGDGLATGPERHRDGLPAEVLTAGAGAARLRLHGGGRKAAKAASHGTLTG